MSYIVDHWGYCSPNCNGEVPLSNQSNYILAHSIYNNMWEEDIYNLETWGEDHCHTYNPPYQSTGGINWQVYALLGNVKHTSTESMFKGYKIYLHEAGQFWP